MTSRFNAVAGAMLSVAVGSAAFAQPITVISQDRFIEGVTHNVAEDGTPFDNGPFRQDGPAGDFSPWTGVLAVPGNLLVNGNQTGGFNGTDTFSLDAFQLTIGGGGGPGSSANATATNRFSYTFSVSQSSTFTLNGLIGSQQPIVLSLKLTGSGGGTVGGGNINDNTSGGDVTYTNRTGTLTAGTYTFTIEAAGSVSYVGPGGNGAGGGATPVTLVIASAGGGCAPDFDHSGSLTVQDIFDFLSAWFAGNSSADFNHANGLEVQDIFDFLAAWFAGCP